MQINNLDRYEDHQKYYELYTKKNTKLNEIIQNIISKYNFDYDPAKYYRLDNNNIITRNIYEISGIIFMLNDYCCLFLQYLLSILLLYIIIVIIICFYMTIFVIILIFLFSILLFYISLMLLLLFYF